MNFPGPIVITGANGGLGSALVADLLAAGIKNLACQWRSSDTVLTKVFAEHGIDPSDHLFQADLTSEPDVWRIEEEIKNCLGTPWGLINLAGSSSNGVSWKLTLRDFNAVLDSNLLSTFLTTRAFLPGMRQQEGGRIINISSVIAHNGMAGASHYCAAKAGIEGFTRAVALETAAQNITCNAICPGSSSTPAIEQRLDEFMKKEGLARDEAVKAFMSTRQPSGRFVQPHKVAGLVAFLCGPDGVDTTGSAISIDGGWNAA